MLRRVTPVLGLALAALACNLGGGAPNSAAVTLTALVTLAATATQPTASQPPASQTHAASETPPAVSTATSTLEAAIPTLTPEPSTPTKAAGTATATRAATASPTSTVSATPAAVGCSLAYADNNNLVCVGAGGTPQTLASGAQLFAPRISPDGLLVAYQVVAGSHGATQLWVASTDPNGGAPPKLLVGQDQLPSADGSQINSPLDYAWLAGTHQLVFDTRYVPTNGVGGPGEYINADLWVVNAGTGVTTQLKPAGQAGAFAVSPNGATIAVAGSQGLGLVNADGSNDHPDIINFPAVTTYGEYTYKPHPQWAADGSFLTVAIPSADPLAAGASATFYRVGADATVKQLATHPGNYVTGDGIAPQIAPDGQHVVYSQGQGAGQPDALHMLTIQSDALSDNVFDTQTQPVGWGWSPDSQVYAYTVVPSGGAGKGYVTGPGVEAPHPFVSSLTGIHALLWADGNHLVYLGQIGNGDWGLYRQLSGADGPDLVVGGLTGQATMDVRP